MKKPNIGKSAGFPKTLLRSMLPAVALLICCASQSKAQIFTDGFEGVTISGSTANNGGATGDANLIISSTSWSNSATNFTTFTGTAPTAATSLATSTATPTTQTWTLTFPSKSCYSDSINKISYNYRSSSSTSYNTLQVIVNGQTVTTGSITANGNWQSVTINIPSSKVVAVSGTNTIKFIMTSPGTNSGGTFRLDNVNLYGNVYLGGSSCSGSPTAGSVSSNNGISFCGTAATTLTLTGATSGCGISYKWQKSTDGTTWSSAGGDDSSLTYAVSGLTTSTYYRVQVTCSNGGTFTATTSSLLLNVNPLPANLPISGVPTPAAIIGNTYTLTPGTPGGFWSSTLTSVATIDGSGVLTPVFGGTAPITYTTVSDSNCQSIQTVNVSVVWPNTLALYAGDHGTSTSVIPADANVTVNTLAYTGSFNGGSNCTSGGLSGMLVPVADSVYNPAYPHVYYKIKPTAGHALTVFRIAARTRESSTGPAKARIAFSRDGGATWAAGAEQNLNRGGSCGSYANNWSVDSAMNGIKDSILVAVFPYKPSSSTGTFQLGTLEVYGLVTSDSDCNRTPIAGYLTPTPVYICDSGSRWLSLDSGSFTGDAGVGVSYQWYKNGVLIPGATNISYNTGELHAGVDGPVVLYTVQTTCSLGAAAGTATSNNDSVNVNATPTAKILNSSLPDYSNSFGTFHKYLKLGTGVTLSADPSTTGGGLVWYTSNDTSSTAIDSFGNAVAYLPGVSYITIHNKVNGCVGTGKDTIYAIEDGSIAAYLGLGGSSTAVTNFFNTDSLAVTALTETGYGINGSCGFGGMSGLTNNGVTSYSAGNAHAYFKVKNNYATVVNIDAFDATVRRSNSGLQFVNLAYSKNDGSTWVDDGALDVEYDDCGYSTVLKSFGVNGASLPSLNPGDSILFGLFAYDPISAGGTFQVNTVDIVSGSLRPVRSSGIAATTASAVKIYPNPAHTTINIAASEKVNVVVMSLDGKSLIKANNAKEVNVGNLANGLYFIQVYNQDNQLMETLKFNKQ
jgi:hypothetical protein